MTLSSFGRKLEPKPDNDTHRKYRQYEQSHVGKKNTRMRIFPLATRLAEGCDPTTEQKSVFSTKTGSISNPWSFPHFGHEALFISILLVYYFLSPLNLGAVIPFPVGLSHHNTDQTSHSWRDGGELCSVCIIVGLAKEIKCFFSKLGHLLEQCCMVVAPVTVVVP